jgi:hypothetical protein
MKPINRAERNNAFLGFLLLFLTTIGIVLTTVFFSIKVPFQENELLRSKLKVIQIEKNLSDSFRVEMDRTLNELAKFDSKKGSATTTNRNVELQIKKMGRLVNNRSNLISEEDKIIYELVLQNLADLNDAKMRIRNLEDQKP